MNPVLSREALSISARSHVQSATIMAARFTDKQAQYLSFIYYYTKVNGRAPAEADMERYFAVTPPSVHQMVLTLESKGLIERTPGLGRSIRLRIALEELPDLK
jgi:DNA-binding MarR family transcriptional regulator